MARNFARFYWLFVEQSSTFAVTARGADGRTVTAQLEGVTSQARQESTNPVNAVMKANMEQLDGPKDNVVRWAEMLNAHGWAAIIVDSHGPRGFSEHEAWRLVCAGQLLMGAERAGDVLVSIDDARRMPFVDPDRIALIGASHGGWAIMDLLALDPPRRLPFNLASLPDAGDPLAGVVGTILLYPYCGPANRARRHGWRAPIPACPSTRGSRHSRCRCASRVSSSARCA